MDGNLEVGKCPSLCGQTLAFQWPDSKNIKSRLTQRGKKGIKGQTFYGVTICQNLISYQVRVGFTSFGYFLWTFNFFNEGRAFGSKQEMTPLTVFHNQ